MRIRWLSRAADDLEGIFDHISRDSPMAAADEAGKVLDAIAHLGEHPALGRAGRVPGTRELVVSSYVVAYRVRNDAVQILRILHGARRWPKKL
ncbi:MAG: type II toxin-antitoxin system RelE/ParE family toxin [Acidobacteriota bacterium]